MKHQHIDAPGRFSGLWGRIKAAFQPIEPVRDTTGAVMHDESRGIMCDCLDCARANAW